MESVKRATKFQNLDAKNPTIVFWLVVLIVDIAFYILNLYGGSEFRVGMSTSLNGITAFSVVGANIIPIIVYFIAYSYEMYYETFPIAISFSVTRKDFFKSLVMNNILVAFIFALIQGTLLKIDHIFVNAIGREPLIDFALFNTNTDSIIFIAFSLLVGFLVFVSVTNIIAALNYTFGFKIWIVFGIVFFFFTTNRIGMIIVNSIESLLITRIDLFQLLKLGIIITICYVLGYLLTIRTNIKNKVG